MNRLTHVREGANGPLLQAYDYDATGNRTARTDGGTTTAYSYSFAGPGPGRHYLQSVGAQTRGYDSVGNTTRIGASSVPMVREFDYDDANRMHAVRHDGVVAMRYLYNAMGERVHRAGSGIAVTTLYDEDGKWIGDYDANGQPVQQVVWLDDLPVGLLVGAGANQKLYYIEADALGTPRVVIDPTRNVAVWRWNLADEAFGDSAPEQDVDGDGTAFVFDMRFPGQRYDSATGLNYNYFRDYDPSTGRYIQSDPIGLDGGMSTYGYANGSPLVYSDPEGMFAALVLRFAMRYALPQAGLRLGATHAVKRVTPRLIRGDIKRVVWHGPKQPPSCSVAANGGRAFWKRPKEFGGNKVYQRDDLVNPRLLDSRGRTNLERMQKGLAPIGPDGKSVNLHHMLQSHNGPIAEVTATFHKKYHSIIHINPSSVPSGINRAAFDGWRSRYWMSRGAGF